MKKEIVNDNTHWQHPHNFVKMDSQLSQLEKLPHVYSFPLLQNRPVEAGIYTLSGGCLTGKTTLLKQWIAALLASHVPPQNILFLPGAFINDYRELRNLIEPLQASKELRYIFLDDVTAIPHWEKAVSEAANAGLLEQVMLIISTRDNRITRTLASLIPTESNHHFHLYPLSFHQFIELTHQHNAVKLYNAFEQYLMHGGFLPAINDVAINGMISDNTLKHYADKLCEEILRQGRTKAYLRDIFSAIILHYCSQVTWNQLSQELTINHPTTIGSYLTLLESLDTVFVQHALMDNTLKPAPKKARKLIFTDPFIFHAVNAWLHPSSYLFSNQIKATLSDNELSSKLVEACVTQHYRLLYPTYYIKAEGEIDLAYLSEQRFWPLLVTWSNHLRPKDLKQILKYANGKILTKSQRSGVIEHVRTEPVALALWKLGVFNTLHLRLKRS